MLNVRVFLILILQTAAIASLGTDSASAASFQVPVSEGAMDLRIHPTPGRLVPPAELLLVDPEGRRVGHNLSTGKVLQEIPEASYESESISDDETGAPGPETKIIQLRNPRDGEYSLVVMGTDSAEYDLEIRGYDSRLDTSHVRFLKVRIKTGETQVYRVSYSSEAGREIVARRLRNPP